jgi:hypothetical protein
MWSNIPTPTLPQGEGASMNQKNLEPITLLFIISVFEEMIKLKENKLLNKNLVQPNPITIASPLLRCGAG